MPSFCPVGRGEELVPATLFISINKKLILFELNLASFYKLILIMSFFGMNCRGLFEKGRKAS